MLHEKEKKKVPVWFHEASNRIQHQHQKNLHRW